MSLGKPLNLREIVVMAFISAVFGVLYLLWIFLNQIVTGVLGPVGGGLMAGFWILAPVVCALIIQKPGAALAAQMIAAGTEVMVGSVNAGAVLLLGLTQGLGAELIFALFLYRNYRLPVLMLAGMSGTFANFLTQYVMYGYSQYETMIVWFMLGTMLVSGALLAGWAGQALSYALVRTGVLNNFALGRSYYQKKMEESA
ncbi:energy-coupling factor transport system substrate-specific component [Alteribacillus persepolensis]|uniref:Energy-coupling factor transport system substrate-specific component n=1 Tax=Alteribacillus persepolensis TaxID=568899 RepID=A0A1G8AZ91_9BACI|nr:ECF transporter S component [Alteribacillus persepolensis]SDH26247.1 energy-coupling factor transport system substrate-specific component [Alteribacillus persepolensis]